jgi:hypothetical protein
MMSAAYIANMIAISSTQLSTTTSAAIEIAVLTALDDAIPLITKAPVASS